MKQLLCAALAALSFGAGAQTVALMPTGNGDSAGSFVQVANGTFIDTFTFSPGAISGNVEFRLYDLGGPINFFTALVNGQGFSYLPEAGKNVFDFTAAVKADQPLQLLVSGYSGDATSFTSAKGLYGGFVTVSAVPEPAGWALLVAGVGVVALRGRRQAATQA